MPRNKGQRTVTEAFKHRSFIDKSVFLPVATSSVSNKGVKGNHKKENHTNMFLLAYKKATCSQSVKISHGIIEYIQNNSLKRKTQLECEMPIVVHTISQISSCLHAAKLRCLL